MPLPAPILDDRSFQQLRDELVRRIPVYAPEWTDHNASDPGITILELMAYVGESCLFRYNQIPEATRLAFLRLLRIPLRPAQPAHALVTMTAEAAAGILVPAGSEAKAGDVVFETRTETTVWPVSVIAVGRMAAAPPDKEKEPEKHDYALRSIHALGGLKSGEQAKYYESRRVSSDDSEPPLDFGATIDGALWVCVKREKGADLKKMDSGIINIGFVPDPIVPSIDDIEACPGTKFVLQAPAVDWQISTGKFDQDKPLYSTLAVVGDTTRGLSQHGTVRLRLPRTSDGIGVFTATDPDLLGTGDRPPALDDETEGKILFWLRASRQNGSQFGKVRFVGANAAEVVQSRAARLEILGVGTAQPNQTYPLVHKPVIERSVKVEVEEYGGWKPWQEVDGFHASGADDRHFLVDREAGSVQFGNGVRGLPPQIGQRIRVVGYRYGGSSKSNVAAKAISKLAEFPSVKIGNPLPAIGGADTESTESALDRIPGELRRRDRAVTADDFRELALATPGADIGRAECLPRFHPPTRTEERAGIVSVMVWPREDKANPNAPLPDRELLRAVCTWLDARRLVTTELYVIPPVYRKVAVAVGLQVKGGYGAEAVRRWVELILRRYLAPLPDFGPEGRGWPLGRRVHGPELEAAALQVEGVEYLEELKVAGWDEATQAWVQGTVQLAPYEVPELTEIRVVEGPLTFNAGDAIGAPATGGVPVPIPVPREEC